MDKFDIIFEGKNITAGYEGRAVVENLNIELRKGEITALIGPNGAGKSTVLKSVIGHLKLIGGVVLINGRSLADMKERETAMQMAVVLTDRTDPELMTCRDVVSLGRYPYTGRMGILTEEDRRAADEAVRLVNAEAYADRKFSEVSDGQKQRIMIARAVCQEPAVMVLDEPTSFLDIKYKLEIMTLLKRLAAEKHIAVLMSVHELEFARAAADYVVCIKKDSVRAAGRPDEIFSEEMICELYDIDPENYDEGFRRIIKAISGV